MPWGTEEELVPQRRGSDVRTVTVLLQSPVEPNMTFIKLTPERSSYFEGESVVFTMVVKNNGGDGMFSVEVYDIDTGEYLGGVGAYCEGGYSFDQPLHLSEVMPNHNWHLRFKVTP